jgi:hypothetical protein
MSLPLGTDHCSAGLGGPTFLPHRDKVFHLKAITNLQFVELGSNLAVTGSHGTTPSLGTPVGTAVGLPPQP